MYALLTLVVGYRRLSYLGRLFRNQSRENRLITTLESWKCSPWVSVDLGTESICRFLIFGSHSF